MCNLSKKSCHVTYISKKVTDSICSTFHDTYHMDGVDCMPSVYFSMKEYILLTSDILLMNYARKTNDFIII